jgi:hypothetical protein
MIFGQDECIFKQYNRSNKSWSDPDGTRALLPKEDGQGVMISAFASREFGFGMQLTASQLDKVNKSRSRGVRKYYSDKNAAISKNGTAKKRYSQLHPLSNHLNMVIIMRGIGVMNAWYSSWKTGLIAFRCCYHPMITSFYLTILMDMIECSLRD